MKNEEEFINYISEKLSIILNDLMITQNIDGVELSRKTGIPTTTINRLRKGAPHNPTLHTLIPLAKYFSLNVSQLIGESNSPGTVSELPLIDWEELNSWPFINEKSRIKVFSENVYSEKAFSLIVKDDDFGKIDKGTFLLIEPCVEPKHHDYVIINNSVLECVSLKQILKEGAKILLKSIVCSTYVEKMSQDDNIIGVLVEYKKFCKQ